MYHGRDPRSIDYIDPGIAVQLPALHWAHGETCSAITRGGENCTRKATYIAKTRTPLCKMHATSRYTIDVEA